MSQEQENGKRNLVLAIVACVALAGAGYGVYSFTSQEKPTSGDQSAELRAAQMREESAKIEAVEAASRPAPVPVVAPVEEVPRTNNSPRSVPPR